MPAPAFSPTVERLYGRYPEHYRDADELEADYPFKRFSALIGDQVGEVEAILDRINYVPLDEGGEAGDTSELVNAELADNSWLDWLAQLVGVILEARLTEAERRDAVQDAPAGWQAGNKTAIAAAAKTALTGTKYAAVYDHSDGTGAGIGTATEWDVLIVTRPSETPDAPAVLATVIAKKAKPAGVVLHHASYEASWDAIEAAFPTWDDIEAAGSWDAIQEAGL